MRRLSSFTFALVLGIGSIAALPCVCAKDSPGAMSASYLGEPSCGARYNSMIAGAKSALMKGDRKGAIRSLQAAKSQLHRCEELEENTAGATALALGGPAALGCRS